MKKRIVLLGLLIVALVLFVGCTKSITDEQVEEDLKVIENVKVVSNNETIKEINVKEKTTDKERGKTVVNCVIVTEDDECSYEKDVELTYGLDEEKKNVLESVSVEDNSDWLIKPIKGVTKEKILASLDGTIIMSDGETWYFDKEKISKFDIVKQDTDLANNKDIISVSVQIEDVIQQADGELNLEYVFEDKWVLKELTGKDNFKSNVKPGMAFNVTDEMLTSVLDQKIINYGVKNINVQDILINKNELLDFTVTNRLTSQKGTVVTNECTATLKKTHATFAITAKIQYTYNNQWALSDCKIEAKCTSVSILGTWAGVGPFFDDPRIIKIESVDEKGNIVGTYTGSGYKTDFTYRISGTFDFNSLFVTLENGELLSGKVTIPYSIRVFLSIEKECFECVGDGTFIATPQ